MYLEYRQSLSEETDVCLYSGLCNTGYCFEKHFVSSVSASASRQGTKTAKLWLTSGEFAALRREMSETSKALAQMEKELKKIGPSSSFTPRVSSLSERWNLTTSVFLFRGKLYPRVCVRAVEVDKNGGVTTTTTTKNDVATSSSLMIEPVDFDSKTKSSVDLVDNATFMPFSPAEFGALRFHEPVLTRYAAELRGRFFVFGPGAEKNRVGKEIIKVLGDFMAKSRYGEKLTLRVMNSDRGGVDDANDLSIEKELKKNWMLNPDSSEVTASIDFRENASATAPSKKRRRKKSPPRPRQSSESDEDEADVIPVAAAPRKKETVKRENKDDDDDKDEDDQLSKILDSIFDEKDKKMTD